MIHTHHHPNRRSSRVFHKPAWLGDYVNSVHTTANAVSVVDMVINDHFQCFSANLTINNDPTSFKQAVQSENWREP